MNFSQLNQIFASDLPCAQRMLLVCLLDLMGKKAYSFPSQETLSKMTGLAERSVRDHMADLIEMGAVSIVGHRGRCNVYSVTLSGIKPAKSAALNRQNLPDTDDANRQNLPPQPAKSAGLTGKICRLTNQEPLNEPLNDAPASPKPRARKPKKESDADSRHSRFVSIFFDAYQISFGAKIQLGPKDFAQLSKLLKAFPELQEEEWQGAIDWCYQILKTDQFAKGPVHNISNLAAFCAGWSRLVAYHQIYQFKK